jgi:hypothetical protein
VAADPTTAIARSAELQPDRTSSERSSQRHLQSYTDHLGIESNAVSDRYIDHVSTADTESAQIS